MDSERTIDPLQGLFAVFVSKLCTPQYLHPTSPPRVWDDIKLEVQSVYMAKTNELLRLRLQLHTHIYEVIAPWSYFKLSDIGI